MLETLRTAAHPVPVAYAAADARQPGGLNVALRTLLARLSQRAPQREEMSDAPPPRRPEDEGWDDSDGPGLGFRIGPAGTLPCSDADPRFARALRAEAHAAFRSVVGSEAAALDAALAVVEGEVARLRSAVLTYGEALKTIRIYGAAGARDAAFAALRSAPLPLGSPPPVPREKAMGDRRG